MSNMNQYKGIITVEIQALMPEKFINILWKNNIHAKNIKKITITTLMMDISLNDYDKVEELAKKTNTKIQILKKKGMAFYIIRLKKRIALLIGSVLFICIIYYLSTFIWNIKINSQHNVSPYEIRQELLSLGIKPGINKRNINVYDIEEKLIKNNDDIIWVKARIEGSSLKISAEERISPPNLITEDSPCNLIASRDSQVVRVYTKAGTAVVKENDIVKRGQLLVKGEQGKEGMTYAVHADGNVIGRTFYEETKVVPIRGTKRVRTGNYVESVYININNKKIYLKKDLNKYADYDRIEDNRKFIKTEKFYEVKKEDYSLDLNKLKEETVNELYTKISCSMDKSVKIISKVADAEPEGDKLKVRLLVIAEENIAVAEKVQ